MNTFEEYIEELSRKHPSVRHGENDKCHFSCLEDDSQIKFARTMYYPCVVVDSADFSFGGSPGNVLLNSEFMVMFLDHVRDTGNNTEIMSVLTNMKKILLDFARRFSRDKRALKHKFLNRFSLIGGEGHRICMKDSALYGYVLLFSADESFIDTDCNNAFDE